MQGNQWMGLYQWMGVDGFAALADGVFTASTFAALRLGTGGYLLLDGCRPCGASGCSGMMLG